METHIQSTDRVYLVVYKPAAHCNDGQDAKHGMHDGVGGW